MMSRTPSATSESTSQAISGRLHSGIIGFGSRYVSGRSRVPSPAARIMDFIGVSLDSQILGRKDHVLRQIGPRAPSLPVEISVSLADRLIHAHSKLGGDRSNQLHGSLDLEVVA